MQGNHAEQNQRIKMSLYQTPLPETINETTIKAALGALAPCNVCKSDSTHGRGGYWNDTRLDLAIEKAEEKRRQRGDDQFKTIGEALSYLEDGFSLIIEPIEEIPTSYRIDSAWTDMGGQLEGFFTSTDGFRLGEKCNEEDASFRVTTYSGFPNQSGWENADEDSMIETFYR